MKASWQIGYLTERRVMADRPRPNNDPVSRFSASRAYPWLEEVASQDLTPSAKTTAYGRIEVTHV